MTALDRALMKAYQRQRVGAPHASFAKPSGAAPPLDDAETVAPELVSAMTADSSPSAPPPIRVAGSETAPALVAGPPPLASAPPPTPALELEHFDWPPLIPSLREALADAWDSLLEQVLRGAHTVLVTGCRRGEGRTSVALLMASMLAAEGTRVGLLDADFAKPGLAAQLGVLTSTCWNQTIAQRLPVTEAMIESLSDRVILLPLGEPSGPPSPIAAASLRAAAAALRAHCELVCIDAGPQMDAGDAAIEALLGAELDAALVVRDARHSRLQQSHAVGRRLAQAGVDRWAILENFARANHV
ncbi:MAG TPA: P-loop NTPase [Pirellulales bacterium]